MQKRSLRRLRSSLVAVAVALGLPLITGAALAPAPATARGAPDSFADLAVQLSPTVVNISTTQTLKRPARAKAMPKAPDGSPLNDFFKDFLDHGNRAPKRVTSLGSGFVVESSGLIVTNNHVVSGADQISVILNDGTSLSAKLIGRDPKTDLALLKVKPKAPLAAARFGDSSKTRVGDWVMAIGNPFGLGGSVTAGIISARNRDINSGPYDDFLQTDAPINRGNSGGPLFNMEGEVVGVNSAIYSPTGGSVGISFAIPSSMVKEVLVQLRQHGEVRRGWLGVRIQQVTEEIGESLGLKAAKGALVAGVTAGGPAAKAGIQNGDLVLAFDGRSVGDSRALPRLVADAQVGKTVAVEMLRKGARKTVQVTVGRLQEVADKSEEMDEDAEAQEEVPIPQPSKAPAPMQKLGPASRLGVAMSPLTPQLRSRYQIDGKVQGVLVTDVADDSPAAAQNIEPGDVIVEVAQEPVKSPAEVTARVEAAFKAARKAVLLLVSRGGELSFVAVNLVKG